MSNNMLIKNYQQNDSFKDHIDCPICYDTTNEFFKSECNHAWCNVCHNNIKSNLCPLCRKEFRKKIKNINNLSESEYLRLISEIRELIRIRRRRRRRNNFFDFIDSLFCIN